MECLKCGKFAGGTHGYENYFVILGNRMVPNSYLLCIEHKDLKYTFDDIYNRDGTRKKTGDFHG